MCYILYIAYNTIYQISNSMSIYVSTHVHLSQIFILMQKLRFPLLLSSVAPNDPISS